MTDLIDTANNQVQVHIDACIEVARQAAMANDISDCIDCGKPIGTVRKRAVPWAKRCFDCQSAHEIKTRL